jgi:hypothetical protein
VQPVVFVQNALELAGLMASSAIAAGALAKARLSSTTIPFKLSWMALLGSVVMTRNVAGNVYAFSASVSMLLLKPANMVRVAYLMALLAFCYPALRAMDLIPADDIVAWVGKYDAERALSLAGRLGEEEFVIGTSSGRRLFGWGDVARTPGALSYDFQDTDEGGNEGGLDGWWTIMFAARGVVGMLSPFALLAIPVFVARRRAKAINFAPVLPLIAGLMFIVAIRMVDLLLNGWWNNIPMFLAGALFGVLSSQTSSRSWQQARQGAQTGGPRSLGQSIRNAENVFAVIHEVPIQAPDHGQEVLRIVGFR